MIWDISVLQYIGMGGWVMLPLLLLSFLLAFLIIERFLYFAQLRKNDITPDDLISQLVGEKGVPESTTGIHRLFLGRLVSARTRYGRLDRSIIDEVVRNIVPEFSKHIKNIGALTAAAPLLGLLGTVSGMVTTFNVMNIFGTGNAKAMSGGISEALITTQYGLVVAIIGMYVSMIINRRARQFETTIHDLSIHIIRKFNL